MNDCYYVSHFILIKFENVQESNHFHLVSFAFDRRSFGQSKHYFASQTKQVQFSREIVNVELMQECFPKQSRTGKARMK